jgi:phosphatidylserine decarboxylase
VSLFGDEGRVKISKDYLFLTILGIWVFSLLLALFLYFFVHEKEVERILYFPRYNAAELEGEVRRLPKKADREKDIELLLREIILGPFDIHHARVLPKDTDVESLLLRKGRVYVDFSLDPVLKQEGSLLSLSERIAAVKRTIRFNFPSVEEIMVTFGGQSPNLQDLR